MATMQTTSNGTITQKPDPQQQLRYNFILSLFVHVLGDLFRVFTFTKFNNKNQEYRLKEALINMNFSLTQ
jgi:hypothetical protein